MTMTLNERTAKFASLHLGIRSNPALAQRVQGFVFSRTKDRKLAEYLNNGAPVEEKEALLDDLIEILEKKEYSRLPAAPSGQAAPTGEAGAPPAKVVAPDPEPTWTKTKVTLSRGLNGETIVGGEKVEEKLITKVTMPEPALPLSPSGIFAKAEAERAARTLEPETPAPAPVADPANALAALIRQLIPAPVAPAAPSLTSDQIRAIVRTELASALELVAAALKGAK